MTHNRSNEQSCAQWSSYGRLWQTMALYGTLWHTMAVEQLWQAPSEPWQGSLGFKQQLIRRITDQIHVILVFYDQSSGTFGLTGYFKQFLA